MSSAAVNVLCEYATFTRTVAVSAPRFWFRLCERTFAVPLLAMFTSPLSARVKLYGATLATEAALP